MSDHHDPVAAALAHHAELVRVGQSTTTLDTLAAEVRRLEREQAEARKESELNIAERKAWFAKSCELRDECDAARAEVEAAVKWGYQDGLNAMDTHGCWDTEDAAWSRYQLERELAEAHAQRVTEVEHWVTRYNELESWRVSLSTSLAAERLENTRLREAFVTMEQAYNQAEAEVERMKLVVMAHKTWENEAVAQASNATLALYAIRKDNQTLRDERAKAEAENARLREQRCETCRHRRSNSIDHYDYCGLVPISCATVGQRCGMWARREP